MDGGRDRREIVTAGLIFVTALFEFLSAAARARKIASRKGIGIEKSHTLYAMPPRYSGLTPEM
jgi:hypothetical protein